MIYYYAHKFIHTLIPISENSILAKCDYHAEPQIVKVQKLCNYLP